MQFRISPKGLSPVFPVFDGQPGCVSSPGDGYQIARRRHSASINEASASAVFPTFPLGGELALSCREPDDIVHLVSGFGSGVYSAILSRGPASGESERPARILSRSMARCSEERLPPRIAIAAGCLCAGRRPSARLRRGCSTAIAFRRLRRARSRPTNGAPGHEKARSLPVHASGFNILSAQRSAAATDGLEPRIQFRVFGSEHFDRLALIGRNCRCCGSVRRKWSLRPCRDHSGRWRNPVIASEAVARPLYL